MKTRWLFVLSTFITFIFSTPVHAQSGSVVFQDSFDSIGMVDGNQTTAEVDTQNGWVSLAQLPLGNAIASSSEGGDLPSNVVVADKRGIHWYIRDQSASKMQQVDALSPTDYTNPYGVALVPSTKTMYVYGKDSTGSEYIKQAIFDGTAAIDNPAMALTGVTGVISITAISEQQFGTADKFGKISVYRYDASTKKPVLDGAHSFDSGLTDIQVVKNIPGSWNFLVVTKHASYLYMYDQSTNQYHQTGAFTVQNNDQVVVAGDTAQEGSLVTLLSTSMSQTYALDQSTTSMKQATMYTVGNLDQAVSVAMPTDKSLVIATRDGQIHTNVYDTTTGSMVEDNSLLITGLTFQSSYESSGVYQSDPISPATPCNMIELLTSEQNDPGTSIRYQISWDGGATFDAISTGQWVHVPPGTTSDTGDNVPSGPFILRAILDNANQEDETPRLTDVKLYGYLDVTKPTTPGAPYANQNPSYDPQTPVTWTPSFDTVQAPSTGASGIMTYYFRYSIDDGATWCDWIDTKTPGYTIVVPTNTSLTYLMQVKAEDYAGNFSDVSPIGSVLIDPTPLQIVPGTTGGKLTVTEIIEPSDDQVTPIPTDSLPVHVKAGGEVVYEVTTKGHAQNVSVTYSDGLTQTLSPKYPTDSNNDQNVWTGYYFPSSTSTIPLSTPQGTEIKVKVNLSRQGSTYEADSDLLKVTGSITGTNNPFMSSYLKN